MSAPSTTSGHYWVDSLGKGTLAHLVKGDLVVEAHDASTLCGVVRTGSGTLHAAPDRACARCVDLLAFALARRSRVSLKPERRRRDGAH